MTHQIHSRSRDLASWEAWARWPNLRQAARAGIGTGAALAVLSLLVLDLRRVFAGAITSLHPLRILASGILFIFAYALAAGLLSVIIAGGVRLIRVAYLSLKRREFAD